MGRRIESLPPEIRSLPLSQRQMLGIGEIIQALVAGTTAANSKIRSASTNHSNSANSNDIEDLSVVKLKQRISSKYGLESSPRLTDIIAAVPVEHRKALIPKLRAKPVRTASGVSEWSNDHAYNYYYWI